MPGNMALGVKCLLVLAQKKYDGEGMKVDLDEAFRLYLQAARLGDPIGQYNVGAMYRNGEGAKKDPRKAFSWFLKSARQGFAEAQHGLASMCALGERTARDKPKALKWYRLAAEQGLAKAHAALGFMYLSGDGVAQDKAEGQRLLRLAASLGDVDAQYGLGRQYMHGDGVAQDMAKGARFFRKAAAKGHVAALHDLGGAFLLGIGVPRDTAKAARLFRMGAEKGNPASQLNLSNMLCSGEGVPQDKDEGLVWLRQSAGQGFATAQYILGRNLALGDGVPEDRAEGLRLLRLSAGQGFPLAQHCLGRLLVDGGGTPENRAEGLRLLRLAAESGIPPDQPLLWHADGAPRDMAEGMGPLGQAWVPGEPGDPLAGPAVQPGPRPALKAVPEDRRGPAAAGGVLASTGHIVREEGKMDGDREKDQVLIDRINSILPPFTDLIVPAIREANSLPERPEAKAVLFDMLARSRICSLKIMDKPMVMPMPAPDYVETQDCMLFFSSSALAMFAWGKLGRGGRNQGLVPDISDDEAYTLFRMADENGLCVCLNYLCPDKEDGYFFSAAEVKSFFAEAPWASRHSSLN